MKKYSNINLKLVINISVNNKEKSKKAFMIVNDEDNSIK